MRAEVQPGGRRVTSDQEVWEEMEGAGSLERGQWGPKDTGSILSAGVHRWQRSSRFRAKGVRVSKSVSTNKCGCVHLLLG